MSVNTNRTKLKLTQCNKGYKGILYDDLYPMYWEDCWSKKSGIYSFKYREYRSWKYNRKTQYKL